VGEYRDLAPDIYRQRLVIEGFPGATISDGDIRKFLSQMSDVTKMTPLIDPVTSRSGQFGWAGWIHWETSGAHFYAWNEHHPRLFFSVDIYTCKKFDPVAAVDFTRKFFNASELVHKEF
jgi:S-adenosylmethionine/arginine decarboxylase-like enzyme